MKRLFTQGLKFLGVTLALYLLTYLALYKISIGKPLIYRTADYYQWKGGVAQEKFAEWDPSAKWDAVVIGSSHAYRGYDPRLFAARGYHMFNLGSTAQTPLSTYTILTNYVDSSHTKLVIIDLYENAMDQDGLESVSDLSQNLPTDFAAAELTARFRDLRGMNMFTLRMLNKQGAVMYKDPNYKGNGFAIKADSVKKKITYEKGKILRLNDRQKEYFVKCLDLCAERGISVVLATHFYPHQSDQQRHLDLKRWVDPLIADRGILWLDFSYSHTMSDTNHFCDHNHMNEAGARIFNERLLDSLEAKGYLPHLSRLPL